MKNKLTAFIVLVTFLNGCAFGTSQLKVVYPDDLQMISETQKDKSNLSENIIEIESGVTISAKWIGNGYSQPTAKSIFGLTNRYVIPYTRLTSLIDLKIENNSDKYVDLSIKNIKLKVSQNNDELLPLDIDFFKSRWPTFAVKSQEMLIDQSVAIGDIIRTIARDKIIEPKSSYHGYLAFKKLNPSTESIELMGLIKVDNKEENIVLKFKKK